MAERAGVTTRTAHAHLTAEAKVKRLIHLVRERVARAGSEWATVYKLNLNRLEDLVNERAQRATQVG